MKLSRNDLCWCGSRKKYKSCHLAFDEKLQQYKDRGVLVPGHDLIKTGEQIEGIRLAGVLNTAILDYVAERIRIGMSTEEINVLVHEYTISHGGRPAPLGFEGYPKSVCTSVNDEVCHGIPSVDCILADGDIVNVDVTTFLDGYYADASRTFEMGAVSEEKRDLVRIAKECLEIGVAAAKPYGFLGDIGAAIERHAHENGCSVVQEIGGHGIGLEFHEEPYVCHIGREKTGMLLVPGMVFTIEPMINAGRSDVYQDDENGWTIYTDDGSPSAQWEYTLVITEKGAAVLTS